MVDDNFLITWNIFKIVGNILIKIIEFCCNITEYWGIKWFNIKMRCFDYFSIYKSCFCNNSSRSKSFCKWKCWARKWSKVSDDRAFKTLLDALKEVYVSQTVHHPCICDLLGYNTQERIPAIGKEEEKAKVALFFELLPCSAKEVASKNLLNKGHRHARLHVARDGERGRVRQQDGRLLVRRRPLRTLHNVSMRDRLNNVGMERPKASSGISDYGISLIKRCTSFKAAERPTFDEIIGDMFCNNFFTCIRSWCESHQASLPWTESHPIASE